MPVVITSIKRANRNAADPFAAFGVTAVHEAMGRAELMAPRRRPVWKAPAVSGTADTALCPPGDNWMIHVAVEQCQEGDVLVVAPISRSESGYFGDHIATSLKAREVRALVIDLESILFASEMFGAIGTLSRSGRSCQSSRKRR